MTNRRWIAPLASSLALVLALGWSVVGAKGPKKTVDWVALDPGFQGATFVNDPESCRACHEDDMHHFEGTKHAQAFAVKPPEGMGACESCHGPRSKHVENPTTDLKIEKGSRADAAVCLQCHEGGSRMGWKAGIHQANQVSCSSCHVVMTSTSPKALLGLETVNETCYTCHGEIRLELNKMSHHPVREGRMDCVGCHNVHGSTPRLLTKNSLNETCYTCHADKRGPFVWEHAPAREDCATCHAAHGSNNRSLLTTRDPFLCLSCHSYGGHINLPRYNRVSNPYGNGCSNCHVAVHGSNSPSGPKLTR